MPAHVVVRKRNGHDSNPRLFEAHIHGKRSALEALRMYIGCVRLCALQIDIYIYIQRLKYLPPGQHYATEYGSSFWLIAACCTINYWYDMIIRIGPTNGRTLHSYIHPRLLKSVTHGQCDGRPMVTFPAARHYYLVTGTKLSRLVTGGRNINNVQKYSELKKDSSDDRWIAYSVTKMNLDCDKVFLHVRFVCCKVWIVWIAGTTRSFAERWVAGVWWYRRTV